MGQKYKELILPYSGEKLLLHSCCAPCACSIIERLKESNIDFVVYFYNPNIDAEQEYTKRKYENERFAKKLNVPFYDGDYINDSKRWLDFVKEYENEPEKGKRCELCFRFRLLEVARFALKFRIRQFTSSLGISRWKDFDQISRIGREVASNYNMVYWDYNWRKGGGNDMMYAISKRENFYRQNYCGCKFSKR